MVTYVLCGAENSKSKRVQELSLGQEATYRFQPPAGCLFQVCTDGLQLRYLSLTETDVLLEGIDCPVKFFTSICPEPIDQVFVAKCPNFFLLLVVINNCNRLLDSVVQRYLVDFISPLAVFRVSETRVVSILDTVPLRQYALAYVVEIIYMQREPGNLSRTHFRKPVSIFLEPPHRSSNIVHFKVAYKINVEAHDFLVRDHLRGS